MLNLKHILVDYYSIDVRFMRYISMILKQRQVVGRVKSWRGNDVPGVGWGLVMSELEVQLSREL